MTEQTINVKLSRETSAALKAEAKRRRVGYHEFAADIVAKVVTDRIYSAVIDP
jgi:hypothetical protein